MKRIIALLLTVVLCFSLCACGGTSNALKEKDLIGEDWYGVLDFTIYGQRLMRFEKGGIGSFVYYEDNNRIVEFSWEIIDNTVKVISTSSDIFGGSNTSEQIYEYIQNGDSIQLKLSEGSSTFVPERNFESETASYKQKLIDEAVVLDWKVATKLRLSNELKFKEEYVGKVYKYTATVYEINGHYCTMANETYAGLPLNSINVYMSPEDLLQLSKHSTITVVGILSATESLKFAFIVEE